MRSTFGSIETSLRGLRAQQLALEVTGHNISNANTPGYSRQVVDMKATDPYAIPTMNRNIIAGQIGTGVTVTQIRRMRDQFVDRRTQYENAALGYWDARQRSFSHLEVTLAEPADLETGASIGYHLNEFWAALQNLGNANRADNIAVRSVVREKANNLCDTIRGTYRQLNVLRENLNTEIDVKVGRINALAEQIANLNAEIAKITAVGDQPNDLMDQREVLVGELSNMVSISVYTDDLNRYSINIAGMLLVRGDASYSMETKINNDPSSDQYGLYDVVWSHNGQAVTFADGELKGLLEMRDEEVLYYMDSLDKFAETLIMEFNAQHAAGYGLNGSTGLSFFSGMGAADITLDAAILDPADGLDNIAASANSDPTADGNGENALLLAKLIKEEPLVDGTTSLSDFYDSLIAKLGIDAEKAQVTHTNQKTLIGHLKNMQESVAGVSLDEEMANLIKFQNAYNAAARMMTAIDEILDKLINGTGIVGR
ncbi:MAG TPA: flagellar hook-associated protein FlgK [Firmicutes bacterium]|jgi:flagellar hook-associated protein 1 FlgK|nr:flagellar hook-associated protein FlgK [Bacillota bacterium]